jgi:hypothetical protein
MAIRISKDGVTVVKGATIAEKRAILDSNKGQFFSCQWIKKDGTTTERNLKQWMDKALVYGKDDVQPNAAAHNPDNYTAADPEKLAKGNPYPWVNVTLSKLHRAKIDGVEYLFEDE